MPLPLNKFMQDATQEYYHYTGSLTTPDCNEIVNWIILKTPYSCNQAQLNSISTKIPSSYRNVKPLNERTVYSAINSAVYHTSGAESRSSFMITLSILIPIVLTLI